MKIYDVIGIITLISIAIFIFLNSFDNSFDNRNNNFDTVKKDFINGKYDISKIPNDYYMRPDFYPFYEKYKNQKSANALYGYGAYPGSAYSEIKEYLIGEQIDIYTFVFSSYDVDSFQGLELYLKSPNDTLFDTHIDPSNILLTRISDNNITDNNISWTYKTKMSIIAKRDIPNGEYIFKLIARQPSFENDSRFYNISKEYNMSHKYISTGFIKPSKFFDFTLKID